jgi:hypothetical protein
MGVAVRAAAGQAARLCQEMLTAMPKVSTKNACPWLIKAMRGAEDLHGSANRHSVAYIEFKMPRTKTLADVSAAQNRCRRRS